MKILFLYLKAFTGVGGIEKFNKALMKALEELSEENNHFFETYSLHDRSADNRYISISNFKRFNGRRVNFIINSIVAGLKSDIVIIGHINLIFIGLILKKVKKEINVILITHGIEVWSSDLSTIKKMGINTADSILAVSNFTKKKLIDVQGIRQDRIIVFPNTLDPYFEIPSSFKRPFHLMEKHDIGETTKVILTVSRMSYLEKYKGYDNVIKALPDIKRKIPGLKYIIVGRADEKEIRRINGLINGLRLEENVILTGFVPDEQIIDYYLLSDCFILPSKSEGFGIVFLEALACGRPVIAGNKDGSVDAILGGKLGKLVNPESIDEISNALLTSLMGEEKISSSYLSKAVTDEFGFDKYKNKLDRIIQKYCSV